MKKRKNKKSRPQMGLLPACLRGVGMGAIISVILLVVMSVICMFFADPDKMITPLSLAASAISFFSCGFCTAKRCKGALPAGALSGAILAVGFWLVSLFLGEGLSWGLALPIELLVRLSFVVVSILGAIIGKARG